MDIEFTDTDPANVRADVLGVGVVAGRDLPLHAHTLDLRLEGAIGSLVASGEADAQSGTAVHLDPRGHITARRLVVAGLGPEDEVDADSVRTAAARAAGQAQRMRAETVAWTCDRSLPLSLQEQSRAAIDGVIFGTYDPGVWKRPPRPVPLTKLILCGDAKLEEPALGRTRVSAEWANMCRTLVNAGGNEVTPERFATEAQEIAQRSAWATCEVMGPEEIERANMGGLLGVAQGSSLPPQLVTIAYRPPAARADLTLGLIGKAITFDAGGLSLKPSAKLSLEKSDMAGGSAVLCAAGAIIEAEIPLNVVAVMAACENMPSGSAYRPGDVITISDGTTVEVSNTDAEGRLALADALVHIRTQGVTHLVDVATLTGATIPAMGDFYGCVFSNDRDWSDALCAAGGRSGDHVWPWPIHRSYRRLLRSTFADLRNYADARHALPIYGAMFLQEFVGNLPWAHVDICGPSNLEFSREDYYTCEGGTGFGVRLLTELAAALATDSATDGDDV